MGKSQPLEADRLDRAFAQFCAEALPASGTAPTVAERHPQPMETFSELSEKPFINRFIEKSPSRLIVHHGRGFCQIWQKVIFHQIGGKLPAMGFSQFWEKVLTPDTASPVSV